MGHATQRTQRRRDGGRGLTVPRQKARPSRIAREGFPHRRRATPPPQLPPPPGRQEANRGSTTRDRSTGRGGLRYRQEAAPRASAARARAGWAHYQSHSPQPFQPPHSSGRTGPHRDRSTHLAHTTPPPAGAVASVQACAHQADSPQTHVGAARHRQPPSSEAKHARVSPCLTASTPPRLPRDTGSSDTRERALGGREQHHHSASGT